MMIRHYLTRALGVTATVILVWGCLGGPDDHADGPTAEARQPVVPPGFFGHVSAVTDGSMSRQQAETALAVGSVGNKDILVATYNDLSNTESTVTITDGGTRAIWAGATMFGWSWSDDVGDTWHYGGKLDPPPGWSVLWGDPSATTAKTDPRYVYIANIAAPDSKFPAGGVYEGSLDASLTPLGGACIARSEDGGKTFSFPEGACVSNEKMQFYDGSSMAAGGDGKIWAAFWVAHNKQIYDVWYADTPTGKFQQVSTPPFEGAAMRSHPRIRGGPEGRVYVVGLYETESGPNSLWITSGTPNGWGKHRTVAHDIAKIPTITFTSPDGSTFDLRGGPEFSFDIDPENKGDDAIRIAYVRQADHHLNIARCPLDLSNCVSDEADMSWQYPRDGQRDPGDIWSPTISFGAADGEARATWMVSFYSRERPLIGDDQVVVLGAEVMGSGSTRSLGPIELIAGAQRPCPTGNRFWGDYNDMVPVRGHARSGGHRFVRAFSDSSGAPCVSETWFANPLHVSVTRFD